MLTVIVFDTPVRYIVVQRCARNESLTSPGAPVLLLRGRQTALGTYIADATRYTASHVPDPHVRGLPGVGHFAPVIEPEPVARELIRFFESVGHDRVGHDPVGHDPVGQLATGSLGPTS